MSEEYDPEQDQEWRARHPNPSGLPFDPDPPTLPVETEHHEEGHVAPEPQA